MKPLDVFDVTGQIRAIETMKYELLQAVVNLFSVSAENKLDYDERAENFSGILVKIYMLSAMLGINFQVLDEKAASNLKLHILQEENLLSGDYAALYKHISERLNN